MNFDVFLQDSIDLKLKCDYTSPHKLKSKNAEKDAVIQSNLNREPHKGESGQGSGWNDYHL